MDELVDEISLEKIVKFLWKMRKPIIVMIVVALLFFGVDFLLSERRDLNDEFQRESGSFSSANLDRVERGIYQLRVEVAGGRIAMRREDTPVDFDQDLEIIVYRRNGFLLLTVTNQRDDIIVQDVEIRGSLRNRADNDFSQISIADVQVNLGYNETSRGVPISIFTTDNDFQLEVENWLWLTDLAEFRANFMLHLIEITFKPSGGHQTASELIRLRYTTSTDFYEIITDEH